MDYDSTPKKGLQTEDERILYRYLGLMKEIRFRDEVTEKLIQRTIDLNYPIIQIETINLQIRKILEIIATSPIFVNEPAYRKLSKDPEYHWRLDPIMKKLQEANPEFYPVPIEIRRQSDKLDIWENKESGFLTAEDLLDSYDYVSKRLHTENPLRPEEDFKLRFEIGHSMEILDKIRNLLRYHTVKPLADGLLYFVNMGDSTKGPSGNVFQEADQILN